MSVRTSHGAPTSRRSIRERAKTADLQRRRDRVARTRRGTIATLAILAVPGLALPLALPFTAPVGAEAEVQPLTAQAQTVTVAGGASAALPERDGYSVRAGLPRSPLAYAYTADTFTNDPNSAVQWPFAVGVPISSRFGPRTPPCPSCSSFHEGVDLAPGIGTPIQAMADGVVTVANASHPNYGVYVIIRHNIDGQMVESLYAHMLRNSIAVRVGEHIRVGQLVGLVGNTGASTGPHLHFEVRLGGRPVDPFAWLPSRVRS